MSSGLMSWCTLCQRAVTHCACFTIVPTTDCQPLPRGVTAAATVLPFVPVDEQPHRCASTRCQACGLSAVSIWPVKTPLSLLVCSGCGQTGVTAIVQEHGAA